MGKLALWGAVGGIGAGMQKNIEEQRKTEHEAEQHEREMAIRKYEAEEAAKRLSTEVGSREKVAGAEIASHEKVAGQEIGARKEMQSEEITSKETEGEKERKFKAGEGAANRATARDVAGIRAAATAARANAGKARWQFSSQKTDATIDPKTGDIIPGKAQQVLRDTNRGLAFIASGDRFLLPDTDPATTKRAAASEVRKLLENPDQADNFLAAYKYLPAQFIARENAKASYVGAQTPAAAPADDSASADTDPNPDDYVPAQ